MGARRHVCIKCICLEVAVVFVFGKVTAKEALSTDFAPLKLSSMPRLMTGQQRVTNAIPHGVDAEGKFPEKLEIPAQKELRWRKQ